MTSLEVTPVTREVTFDANRLGVLATELARLNKVAAKLGVEGLTMTEVARGSRTKETRPERWGGRVIKVEIETVTVVISGASPRLPGGWTFLGSVEFLPNAEDGSEIRLVHGNDERLAPYRESGPDCDHCGVKRARKKTVVLVNEADELTRVGSKCLKDFLGYHGDPERVVRFAEDVADTLRDLEDEDEGFGGRVVDDVPTDVLVALSVATVRAFGWVAKSSYGGVPSATRVEDILWPPSPNRGNGEYLEELATVEVTDEDVAKAAEIKVWVKAAAEGRPGDNYLGNLGSVLAGSYVSRKHFGLAVSVVGAYDKAMGREVERKVKAEAAAASEWVGTVGKREAFTATVVGLHTYEGAYGSGRVVKMLDGAGNVVKTMTSSWWAFRTEVGDELEFMATVKGHELWNGAKESMLTRVKVTKGERAR